jgi:hypothetical protein
MLLAILATTAALTIMTSSIGAGKALAANPCNPTICHPANQVASVSKNGADSVQHVMEECKATAGNSAKECATGTTTVTAGTPGPGQFASTLAHSVNGPGTK